MTFRGITCTCYYCTRLGYVWKDGVGSAGIVIWVEIPKNGSSVLKAKTFESRIKIKPNSIPLDKKGVVVLRDPIDRFKSMISHYFIDGARSDAGKAWLRSVVPGVNVEEIDLVPFILDNFDKIGSIAEPHHFFPQTTFIPDRFYRMHEIDYVPLPSLSQRFNIPQTNTSSSHTVHIPKEYYGKIREIYQEDFELMERIGMLDEIHST